MFKLIDIKTGQVLHQSTKPDMCLKLKKASQDETIILEVVNNKTKKVA